MEIRGNWTLINSDENNLKVRRFFESHFLVPETIWKHSMFQTCLTWVWRREPCRHQRKVCEATHLSESGIAFQNGVFTTFIDGFLSMENWSAHKIGSQRIFVLPASTGRVIYRPKCSGSASSGQNLKFKISREFPNRTYEFVGHVFSKHTLMAAESQLQHSLDHVQ